MFELWGRNIQLEHVLGKEAMALGHTLYHIDDIHAILDEFYNER
jgi:hypothetical protein